MLHITNDHAGRQRALALQAHHQPLIHASDRSRVGDFFCVKVYCSLSGVSALRILMAEALVTLVLRPDGK